MLFALICTDKPDSLHIRQENRPAHLDFLKGLDTALKAAGPFLDDNGVMCGSLVVIEAADKTSAQLIANQDPYAQAGLFQNVEVRAWNWVIKNPENN